jgi:D-alanyl-D-alanine dipeptidase
MRLTITVLSVLIFISAFGQKAKVYNSNLHIVSALEEYQESVISNPNNQLVDIEEYIPDIVLDVRYATENNFTSQKVYTQAKAFVRWPLANSLKFIQDELRKQNLSLKIYDAYRPYTTTVLFYEIYKDTTYVASPWSGSRHNRGAAVDVSIVDRDTGEEIQMPSAYDDFTEIAHPDYMDLPENVIQNRDLLITVMQQHGFKVYHSEWWHFDFMGWEGFSLMDISFEELVSIKDEN